MSEQIKNTLFNFRNFRSPELISTEILDLYYVKHPNNLGLFFNIAQNANQGNKRNDLIAFCSTFSEISEDNLKSINLGLYDFAIKILRNKYTITFSELLSWKTGILILTNNELEELWDNLFYQTITNKNEYSRDVILALLIGNHVLQKFSIIEQTNEAAQKLVLSRVIMPFDVFGIEDEYHTNTSNSNSLNSGTVVMTSLNSIISNLKSSIALKALREIEIKEKAYFRVQREDEATFAKSHLINLKNVVMSAPTEDVIDQFSNFTFTQFTGTFNPPEYTYTPTDQIITSEIQAELSEDSFYLINENNLLDGNTFSEVKSNISTFINDNLSESFSSTTFFNEEIDINGVVIPTCSLANQLNSNYNFAMQILKISSNKFAILVSIDIKSNCMKLISGSISFTSPNNITLSCYNGYSNNGILNINFTENDNFVILANNQILNFNFEITLENGLVLNFSGNINNQNGAIKTGNMTKSSSLTGNQSIFIPSNFGLTRIGIAEYKRVEQYLCCYEPGEVSHIENVMAKEYKERSTRRLRRSEQQTTTTFESETENLTDTSTSNRFDLQKEINSMIQSSHDKSNNFSFHTGASFENPALGSLQLSADFGSNSAKNSSKQDSNRETLNTAKEITQKALDRVISKIKDERIVKIIEEFEEQNRHGFDNRQGILHVSGVYRWVDAIYKNQIYNFGKRLQYEFMIPEPSAFHMIAKAKGAQSGNEKPLIKPLDPRKDTFGTLKPLKSASDINEYNYQLWASAYLADVDIPPSNTLVIGRTYRMPDDGKKWHEGTKAVIENIDLPDGYGLNKAYVSAMGERGDSSGRYYIAIGDNAREYWTGNITKQIFLEDNNVLQLDKYSDSIPLAIQWVGLTCGVVIVSIELSRKIEIFKDWQLKTYNLIIKAYESRLEEYNSELAELEIKRGNKIKDNPSYYRDIELNVLKKNCISYLIGHVNMGKSFTKGSHIKDFYVNLNSDMDHYAATVKFFEQAFEWDILSYRYYPFYWASSDNWFKLYGIENEDPRFKAFLSAGMARVIVTVRPEFQEAVLFYMKTGQIWNGGEVPVLGDKLYLSILEELKDTDYLIEEPWMSRIPTSLTLIQQDTISLNATGLPCWCNTQNPPSEEIVPSNALTNLTVNIPT